MSPSEFVASQISIDLRAEGVCNVIPVANKHFQAKSMIDQAYLK